MEALQDRRFADHRDDVCAAGDERKQKATSKDVISQHVAAWDGCLLELTTTFHELAQAQLVGAAS